MKKMNSRRKFINVNFTMSYEEYKEGFIMPEFHFHNDYEMYLLEYGNRIVSIADEEIKTTAGDAVFFAREELHKSRGNDGFGGICVHFSERFLTRYFSNTAISKIMEIIKVRKLHLDENSISLIKKMTDEFVIDDEYNFLRLAKLFEILHENMKSQESKPAEDSRSLNPQKSTQLFTYVDENYAYIKDLKELSDLFEISESYLFKLFQKEYGMTPKTYINKLRIQNICSRLKHSNRTIKSIAADYGFDSYEHFCRVFKKEVGICPTEYRKQF